MKKFLILIFIMLIAPEVSGIDFIESINLSENQKEQIEKIKTEEEAVLRPYILDISAKEKGLEFLKNLKCGYFDYNCKNKLKEDIEQREFEKRELMKKVEHKKTYYEIRYRNVLTKNQLDELDEIKTKTALKEKVLTEREARAKKEARLEKMKVWKKVPVKMPERKVKGSVTGF